MGDYATAVYSEECDALAANILKLCNKAAPDDAAHIRQVIISAALLTVAQVLDGNKMPQEAKIIKPEGITSILQECLSQCEFE